MGELKHCEQNWKMGYPGPKGCNWWPTGQKQPREQVAPPKPPPPNAKHNILYLIDEHSVSRPDEACYPTDKNGTLRKRYAFYYATSNLQNFNVGETPITIQLHDKVANPSSNPNFKWEGFMFDIPSGSVAFRCGIVQGAESASNGALDGHGKKDDPKAFVDRPIGFGASYEASTPIGPIVQVRRDDLYRVVGAWMPPPGQGKGVAWHLAYYISKDTPAKPSADITPEIFRLDADQSTSDEHQRDSETNEYDRLMDGNVEDGVEAVKGEGEWGGNAFSGVDAFTADNQQYEDDQPQTG